MTAKKGTLKILVCGDVFGSFAPLFKRVALINSKVGPFEMLLCVGEFFGPSQEDNQKLLDGVFTPPIPTYILGPCSLDSVPFYSEEKELGPNLTYLGSKGVLHTPSGLSVAYLSGIESQEASDFQFNSQTIQELLVPATAPLNFQGVDILLTSQWPKEVEKYAATRPQLNEEMERLALVSKVATVLISEAVVPFHRTHRRAL